MSGNSTTHVNDEMNRQVVKTPETVATGTRAGQLLDLDNNMAYISADAYGGDPEALLGTVIEIRKVNGKCPPKLNSPGLITEFSKFKVRGFEINEKSRLKEPIKRESILVDQKLSSQVSFLNYLSVELDAESSISLMVFDQAAGLIDQGKETWDIGLNKWLTNNDALLQDENICYLFAITGFVQKYVIRKKYKKFDVKAKGGAWGVNINGELFTSDEDYSLDIRYGLQPVVLKRPAAADIKPMALKTPLFMPATERELELLQSVEEFREQEIYY